MNTNFITLVTRDVKDSDSLTPTMANLLIALLVLVIVALLAVMGLYFLRQRRRRQADEAGLPLYNEKRPSSSRSNHGRSRHLTIRPSESIYVYQEKQNLIANSEMPPSPTSPIPEIRITFPEEVDDFGKRQSGRVVVVRVGEQSIGLEPVADNLPPYQQSDSDRFQSLDLDRIGGLNEKDVEARWQ